MISLCCITTNEEMHVVRFLDSFADAFDELCLVRACGSLVHDKTLTMAKEWCEKHGKKVHLGEYLNAPGHEWPHCDDFAAARNRSWQLATGEWQFWADLDDLLEPGCAEKIRAHAAANLHDGFFFRYCVRTTNENVIRERMFRCGIVRWELPIHERCGDYVPRPDGKGYDLAQDESVIFSHCPQPEKLEARDPMRNLRILTAAMRYQDEFPWYLANEWFYRYQWGNATHKPEVIEEARKQCVYWAEIANRANTLPEQKVQLFHDLAHVYSADDVERSIDLCWEAIRLLPWRRECWGALAEYELAAGRGSRADIASELMMAFKKAGPSVIPVTSKYNGWEGLTLRARCLRANEQPARAREMEDATFQKNGARISLLHATRGRPAQAVEARAAFFKSAVNPLGVEHIFAIDADDTESIAALKTYRHVIVPEPRGCVKAWNSFSS